METSDPRFGIELYDAPSGEQDVDGTAATLVGHIWSPDAERIAITDDGRVVIVDPSGSNPTPLNSSVESTRAFVEAFRVYYARHRPTPAPPMTHDEARARLAALQRGEAPSEPEPIPPIPQAQRLETLTSTLEAIDPDALAAGSWWSRILEQLT